MVPLPYERMRLILLLQALLFAGCISICSLFKGYSHPLIAALGLLFPLILALTVLFLRVEAGEAMDDALEEKHHALLNDLQVIYGLLQLGKADRALEYVDGILGDG
ncbi:MAG: hypothetical protein GX349_06360 [Firmicutes bacterium]|nr:hypothetical protein [Bacillota bacterium]